MRIACLITLAVGCNYTVERYEADLDEYQCDIYADCLSLYESVDACMAPDAAVEPTDRTGCTYDEEQARACTDAWADMTCPSTLAALEEPVECSLVWSCAAE